MCDRVIVMYGGQLMEEGTVYEIFNNPNILILENSWEVFHVWT